MDPVLLSGGGIVLMLLLIAFLSYKGINSILLGLIGAIITTLVSRLPLVETMRGAYQSGVGGMVTSVFLMLGLGAIFGKLYEVTGAGTIIARRLMKLFGSRFCIWGIMIISGLLCLGGMGYGVYFILYPCIIAMFRKCGFHRNIAVCACTAPCWTWAYFGPFSTSFPNVFPMTAFGTAPYAGLIPGLAGGLVLFLFAGFYLPWQSKQWIKKDPDYMRLYDRDSEIPELDEQDSEDSSIPNYSLLRVLIPLFTVLILFNVVGWHIEESLFVGILVMLVVLWKAMKPKEWVAQICEGAKGATPLILYPAAIVGIGSVVRLSPVYTWMLDFCANADMNPYILVIITSNVLSFLLASSTAAISLSVGTMADIFLGYADMGYNIGNIHRLMVMASGGLDSMPWNGGIVTSCAIFKSTIKESYFPIFITCTLMPILTVICVALPLAMLGFT